MKAHLVKGSTLWCSHDFRPRSIVLLGIHMMCPPFIIRHATNEELSLDAHDEKSQGWCWRLVTSVVKKKITHDDDYWQSHLFSSFCTALRTYGTGLCTWTLSNLSSILFLTATYRQNRGQQSQMHHKPETYLDVHTRGPSSVAELLEALHRR